MTNTLRNMPRYIRNTDAFGWQGADNPDGPWRSIAPPQSGTPWQQGSTRMDDLRQASAEVSGVEVLSPATLHIWDAFCNIVEDHGPPRHGLAAAIRALADHQAPAWDGGPLCHWTPTPHTRQELRNIAAELEAHHD